jgi:hypothetical protein
MVKYRITASIVMVAYSVLKTLQVSVELNIAAIFS